MQQKIYTKQERRQVSGVSQVSVAAPRGSPVFAASQREKILQLLRQAGPMGVSREDLIFRYRWTQAGTRVFELEQQGYVIRHDSRPGDRFVTYVLESERLELKPLPSGADWYEQKFAPRPAAKPEEPPTDLPLFAGVRL